MGWNRLTSGQLQMWGMLTTDLEFICACSRQKNACSASKARTALAQELQITRQRLLEGESSQLAPQYSVTALIRRIRIGQERGRSRCGFPDRRRSAPRVLSGIVCSVA